MKKLFLLLLFVTLLGFKGFSQFAFGVSPGFTATNAYFGYKAGAVVPYVAFMYANAGFTMDYSDHYFDGVDWQTVTHDTKISGHFLMPTIGIKFFAIEKNKLSAYFNLAVTKPFVRGKAESDGTEEESVGQMLKDIKLIGGNFGFGVEYFFDDNFSVGGEYGIQALMGKYEDVYDYVNSGQPAQQTTTYKPRFAPTYAKISLNFYFGGSGE